MSRSLILGFVTYSLIVAGIATLRGELIALALPFVAFLLAGYVFAPDKIKLEATRHLSAERVSPHQEVTVTVTIMNRGTGLEEVLIEDIVPAELKLRADSTSSSVQRFGTNRHLVRLPKDSSYTFSYTVSGPRGGYGFEKVRMRVRDHLAVTSREVQIEAKGQLFVFPPVTRLRQVSIRPRRTRVYAGTIPARIGGSGTEFFGVREYQPGDSPRTINWRASAHSVEGLYSNEFQQERVADVGIVLDGRVRTNEFARGHSLFEHSVQAAAALADAFLAQGNRVGLLVYAAFLSWTIPGYGKVQRERILHSLAHARPGGSEVFSDLGHLPTRLFPPESQIVLVSPLLEDDLKPLVQLRAQGYQVLLVSPDPVKFELSYLPQGGTIELASRVISMERTLLLQKVQRAGIQVLNWDVDDPFDQVVKRKLSRPPAWLRAVGR
ncbi:MAG: DUF58 domain-containing protein [Anaerolineales bacterium]|nr:DUF58 domain-containing protein [Anaerolineae bacterium]PWB71768.1 MAG: DUF58 domain-containing protein [Anaerolineales bacterium]